MKKSIILAVLILLLALGWILSGQLNYENKDLSNSNSYKNDEILKKETTESADQNINKKNEIKVETKVFNSNLIDQSIELQGQTIYNKKIDVKSKTTGNITSINFERGNQVIKNKSLLNISKENRIEMLNSAKELVKVNEIEYSSVKQLVEKQLSSESKLRMAAYNLSNAISKLKDIEIDIKNTNIVAPFNGIIVEKKVEVGDYVTPGNILLTIVNLNPIKIQAYLSEFDVNKVKLNTKTIIEDSNGIKKNGIITFISPSAETSTRTFEIIIEAENKDHSYKSGITTKIIIKGSELKAHKIPPSILTLLDDGTVGVKALNNNIVTFYPTKTIKDTIDGMWVAGLPDSVNLIVSGQEYVSIGEKIN